MDSSVWPAVLLIAIAVIGIGGPIVAAVVVRRLQKQRRWSSGISPLGDVARTSWPGESNDPPPPPPDQSEVRGRDTDRRS